MAAVDSVVPLSKTLPPSALDGVWPLVSGDVELPVKADSVQIDSLEQIPEVWGSQHDGNMAKLVRPQHACRMGKSEDKEPT